VILIYAECVTQFEIFFKRVVFAYFCWFVLLL